MTDMIMAFPLLPGKGAALKAFANALRTDRKAEYDRAQASVQAED